MSNTSKTYTVAKDITLKSGYSIPVGEKITLEFVKEGFSYVMQVIHKDHDFKIRNTRFFNYLQGVKVPSEKTLWKWSEDGVAKSVFGNRVEPDGVDPKGAPSWLLLLGYI